MREPSLLKLTFAHRLLAHLLFGNEQYFVEGLGGGRQDASRAVVLDHTLGEQFGLGLRVEIPPQPLPPNKKRSSRLTQELLRSPLFLETLHRHTIKSN